MRAAPTPAPAGRWSTPAVLAILGAQFLTALADNALLLVAIAALEARHAPAWATPTLRVGFYASYVLLAPLCGRWADAWPKGRLMSVVNLVKLAGVLALACGAGPLLVFAAIGCAAAVYAPARYGMLPELTAGRSLVQANAAMEIVTVVAILGGAALGSALVGAFSTGASCVLLGALYAVGAACTLPLLPGQDRGAAPRAGIGFRAALAVLLADPPARHSLGLTSIFWAAAAVLQFLMIDWARRAFGLSLAQAALVPALFAVGLVAGALVAGNLQALAGVLRPHYCAYLCGVALGAAILALPLMRSIAPACALLLGAGLLAGALLVPMNATLQQRGASLLSPGLSVAVQNFLENGLSIAFLAAYGAALAFDVTPDGAIRGLGVSVILLVALTAWRGNRPGRFEQREAQ